MLLPHTATTSGLTMLNLKSGGVQVTLACILRQWRPSKEKMDGLDDIRYASPGALHKCKCSLEGWRGTLALAIPFLHEQ